MRPSIGFFKTIGYMYKSFRIVDIFNKSRLLRFRHCKQRVCTSRYFTRIQKQTKEMSFSVRFHATFSVDQRRACTWSPKGTAHLNWSVQTIRACSLSSLRFSPKETKREKRKKKKKEENVPFPKVQKPRTSKRSHLESSPPPPPKSCRNVVNPSPKLKKWILDLPETVFFSQNRNLTSGGSRAATLEYHIHFVGPGNFFIFLYFLFSSTSLDVLW